MGTDSWFSRIWRAPRRKVAAGGKQVIGVLAFEVASLMSKVVALWQSLGDDQIARLRDEILRSEGVRKLVSDDDDYLLALVLDEMFDALGFVSRVVARLGKRCSDPLLRGLDTVFDDLLRENAAAVPPSADPLSWQFSWKKMGRKVKKMERFIAASTSLYQEMEVLTELEQNLRRLQASGGGDGDGDGDGNGNPNRTALLDMRQKVVWQRQEVKSNRENSLWNRSYDYTVMLLVRSLFTIFDRMKHVFGFGHHVEAVTGELITGDSRVLNYLPRSQSISSLLQSTVYPSESNAMRFASGPLGRPTSGTKSGPLYTSDTKSGPLYTHSGQLRSKPKRLIAVSGPFRGCITGVGGQESPIGKVVGVRHPISNGIVSGILRESSNAESLSNSTVSKSKLSIFSSKGRLTLKPPHSTLGAAALALHYANVIIVIEKFVTCPHLIAPDARDDLYIMLPVSIRAALRARLKSYSKSLALGAYDACLAAEWTDAMGRILEWLAPLAHNMIRWQSERTFEQQHLVSRTNVLLVQTLHFANQGKTEAAITELLVGLNYICRFQGELHQKAMLEAAGSIDFGDYLDVNG